MDRFEGRIVHPQTWPEDLDTEGKEVVVSGSGATAATLVPAIAPECSHITMLQRSPTYFRTGRNAIEIADELRELGVDEAWIHEIVRRKILYEQDRFTHRTFTELDLAMVQVRTGSGRTPDTRRNRNEIRLTTGENSAHSATPSSGPVRHHAEKASCSWQRFPNESHRERRP